MVDAGGVLWKLVALSVAKKVSVLLIARLYGFPRLYKRMMEANKRLVKDKQTRNMIRDRTQAVFRFPRHVAEYMQKTRTADFSMGLAAIPFLATGTLITMKDALDEGEEHSKKS